MVLNCTWKTMVPGSICRLSRISRLGLSSSNCWRVNCEASLKRASSLAAAALSASTGTKMQTELSPIPSRRPLSGSPDWCRLLAPAAEGGASQAHSARGDRILIVEDDLLVANQMEAALSDAGFDVAGTATTREEALQLAQAKSPTLVIMDIRL